MKWFLSCLLIWFMLVPGISAATIPDTPDYTLLWNDFSSVTAVDSFLVVGGQSGLMTCRLDSSGELFEPINYLFLPSPPEKRHRSGDILIIRSLGNVLYFIDLSKLPELTLLGKVELEGAIKDFILKDSDLYVASGFDGLRHYRLIDYNAAHFVDSSLLPVLAVSLALQDTLLYVADNYNGVLAYDIGRAPARFLGITYMEDPPRGIIIDRDTAYVWGLSSYIRELKTDSLGPRVLDSLFVHFVPDQIFKYDSIIVSLAFSGSWLDMVSVPTGARHTAPLSFRKSAGAQGSLFIGPSERWVVIPSSDGSLRSVDVSRGIAYTVAPARYARPGPITSLFLADGRLFTGGTSNPLDEFVIQSSAQPVFRQTFLSSLNNVRSLQHRGNSLFALYPQIEGLLHLLITPDDLVLDTQIYIDTTLTFDLRYPQLTVGGRQSLYGLGSSHMDIYAFDDTSRIDKLGLLSTIGTVLDVEVFDSLLVFSTNKFSVWVYRIFDDFGIEYRATLPVTGRFADLIRMPRPLTGRMPRLAGFSGNWMYLFNLFDPSSPSVGITIPTPISVEASAVSNELLYLVGPEGLAVYDIRGSIPVLIEYGGRGGSMIDTDKGIVAVSDGHRIDIYDLRSLLPAPTITMPDADAGDNPFDLSNAPNPFNPTTQISFTVPSTGLVKLTVYNLLGQYVASLVNGILEPGKHYVGWTGTDAGGNPVASGLYIYRLSVNGVTASRKMVLLR